MSASRITEFKSSGKFDDTRAELIAKYKESQAKVALEAAVSDHVARTVQTNPELLRNRREAVTEIYRQVRQNMRLATLTGTQETNEFLDSELQNLEETLNQQWNSSEAE